MSDEIEIQFFDGLNNTPALELAMRGWAEMHEKGLSDGNLNIHSSLKAFVAIAPNGHDKLPVGVMTFDPEPTLRRVWIFQSYVIPEFRGRGIYTALWNKLVEYATVELKAKSIQSGTHVRNSAMRAVAKRQGRYEESVLLRFDLP